jgi:hypothetical protein
VAARDLVKHRFKTAILSGARALCMTLFACTSAPSAEPAQAETSAAITATSGNVCDQFCQSQGGPNYLILFATSETRCNQRGGDWYTADQGYEGFAAGLLRQVHRAGVLPVAKRSSAAHLPTRFRFHARGFTVSCTP